MATLQKTSKQYCIGVVGYTGFVGSQLFSYLKYSGNQTCGIDINTKNQDELDSVYIHSDIIFICVPTPYSYKKQMVNISTVEDVISNIQNNKKKIVVIKSTIPPGTTNKIQNTRKDLKILVNPEFLSRNTAKSDFLKPMRQIIGYTSISCDSAKKILKLLPYSTNTSIIPASEAELIKYMSNAFGSLIVIFANQIHDLCIQTKIDYNSVIKTFTLPKEYQILQSYSTIFHNKKRGFAGPCFPKDLNGLIAQFDQNSIPSPLLKQVRKINRALLRSQHLTEKNAEKF